MAHDGQHCSHFCANTHRSLLLHLSLVLAFVYLCSQMDEHQHVRPSTGTAELNHSYYAGNSLSARQSSQQFHDDTVSTSVHPLVSTQETNGTTSSGSAFGPQLPHGPFSSHVIAAPLATSQAKECHRRSPRPSRSSHSLSSYSAATS